MLIPFDANRPSPFLGEDFETGRRDEEYFEIRRDFEESLEVGRRDEECFGIGIDFKENLETGRDNFAMDTMFESGQREHKRGEEERILV